jgi:hypothetical protein
VIEEKGIIYDCFESPDLVSVPFSPAGDRAEWNIEMSVPEHENGFYIFLSVESKKQRLLINYLIDVTDR